MNPSYFESSSACQILSNTQKNAKHSIKEWSAELTDLSPISVLETSFENQPRGKEKNVFRLAVPTPGGGFRVSYAEKACCYMGNH